MKCPFPGMDPYLERADLWPGVHNGLIAALQLTLGPALRPRYYVRIDERVYLAEPEGLLFVGRPDVAVVKPAPTGGADSASSALGGHRGLAVEVPVPDRVRETFLEVCVAGTGEVVTVVELLSPSNKRAGAGRRLYEEKRREILGTRTSLVEIDLIRAGDPMPVIGNPPTTEYRILVSRGDRRPRAELFSFGVRDAIPGFRLPLRPGDDEPEVDVGAILRDLYERAAYDLSIDYGADPTPPLGEGERAWADERLRAAGVR